MTHDEEQPPGATVPVTGRYRLLNVFGTPTDHSVHIWRGEALPAAGRGHSWRLEQQTDEDY
jgi:hypothetical protein